MSCNPAGISRMSATIAMALLGLTTVILVLLYGQSRIFATMANDGLLPPVFARIHPRLGTPWISQLIIGVGSRDRAGDLLPLRTLPVTLARQVRKDHDYGRHRAGGRSCPAKPSSWRSSGAAG
jgi:hypothetical protein